MFEPARESSLPLGVEIFECATVPIAKSKVIRLGQRNAILEHVLEHHVVLRVLDTRPAAIVVLGLLFCLDLPRSLGQPPTSVGLIEEISNTIFSSHIFSSRSLSRLLCLWFFH